MSTLRLTATTVPLWQVLKRTADDDTPADRILMHFGIVTPPVPIEKMASALGFAVVDTPLMGSLSGGIDTRTLPATISLRSTGQSTERKRFTLAHEIGHAMLHPPGTYRREDYKDTDAVELQANRFAAQLLMPEWMLDLYVGNRKTKLIDLARRFGVSSMAMEMRLRQIGVIR